MFNLKELLRFTAVAIVATLGRHQVNAQEQVAAVVDKTKLEICVINNSEELFLDLEFEGYNSAGL